MKKDFRIVQISCNEFYIQKKVIVTKKTGFLWWIKKEEIHKWRRVTKHGQFFILSIYYSNLSDLIVFKTKEDAIEWIEDFNKYPIYHYTS